MKGRKVIYYKSVELWVYLHRKPWLFPSGLSIIMQTSKKNNIAPRNFGAAAVLNFKLEIADIWHACQALYSVPMTDITNQLL